METQVSTRSWRARPLLVLTAAATATALATTMASGTVVIHDSTWMTDEQSYDAWIQSNIAALTSAPGSLIVDHNAASNFVVSGGAHSITSVTGDFLTTSSGGFSGEGVLVEIFADEGNGSPSNNPTIQFFATEGNGLTVESFIDTVFGAPAGLRFNIDISGAGVTLNEGSWWLSIVAVHEATPSQPYFWVRQQNSQEASELHIRKGAEAHGNDHGGTWGTFDWAPISQQLGLPAGDPAFAMTATALPAPGVIAALGIAGLVLRSRRRT